MVAARACFFPSVFSPLFRCEPPSQALKLKSSSILSIAPARFEEKEKEKQRRSGWEEYFEQAKELIEEDGGPPRWFSPLECSSQWDNSPLILFLPVEPRHAIKEMN
ncbi:hypothetical protein MTR_7g083140 [Medicago truncatula]|uniref:Uncharacterized protein n=1 Tax=Medicago truncatula TaxID=3880 RepID=G7KW50_MEDTR|nr:hypothetical protein MTR_7g083140 [Medicago truncatula]